MVMACVIFISMSQRKPSEDDDRVYKTSDKYIAISLAILEGVLFSVRTADMYYGA